MTNSKVYSVEKLFLLRPEPGESRVLREIGNILVKSGVSEISRQVPSRRGNPSVVPPPECPKPQAPQIPKRQSESESSSNGTKESMNQSGVSEWRYRGRSTVEKPERPSNDPITAPASLSNQLNEGFQRFYKAVASPTHVRVTAGGRIVPNTRGLSSPTAKVGKDGGGRDPSAMRRPASQTSQTRHDTSQSPQAQPAIAQQSYCAPGFPSAMTQFSHFPMGFNVAGNFAFPHFAVNGVGEPGLGIPTTNSQLDGASGIRLSSSSSALDASRPCFVNGQWFVPFVPGQPQPYGVPGLVAHPGLFGSMLGSFVQHSTQVPMAPQNIPNHSIYGQYGEQGLTNNPGAGFESTTDEHPVTSIRRSQITKAHIDALRQNLRRIEDQIQYNAHQIDVNGMEKAATEIRISLKKLEIELPIQLDQESRVYEKMDTEPRADNDGSNSIYLGVEPSRRDNLQNVHKGRRDVHRAFFGPAKRGKSPFSFDAEASTIVSEASTNTRPSSGLPMTAAAAPPFQPRADLLFRDTNRSSTDCGLEETSGLLNRRALGDEPSKKIFPDTVGSRTRDYQCTKVEAGVDELSPKLENDNPPETSTKPMPYLVGTFPQGIDTKAGVTKSTGILYPRALTDEEIKARQLYWGQVPKLSLSGLPKFDGKDFYPPSPSKDQVFGLGKPEGNPSTLKLTRSGPSTVSDPFAGMHSRTSDESGSSEPSQAQTEPSLTRDDDPDIILTGNMNQCPKASRSGKGCASSTPSLPLENDTEEHILEPRVIVRSRRSVDRSSASTLTKKASEVWQRTRKRGQVNGSALPGEVTSAIAQGHLPHYAGFAAASLGPAIANSAILPSREGGKQIEQGDSKPAIGVLADVQRENKPPSERTCNDQPQEVNA